MTQELRHIGSETIKITCSDEYVLTGDHFRPVDSPVRGIVVIAGATGVLAKYYHRYAKFLAEHGYCAITFDYRGIGASAPTTLRGFHARWYEWGYQDVNAALRWARENYPNVEMQVIGHSFGGFGVGLAEESRWLTRILTVGAQHAYLPDYAASHRREFVTRWHLQMPLIALLHGYVDGKARGWLEDIPRGVALDWARSRKNFVKIRPRSVSERLRAHQQALTAKILAVAATDDPFATVAAMNRTLAYTPRAAGQIARLEPQAYDLSELGHFALFHSRFSDTFWTQTLDWLGNGNNPWSHLQVTQSLSQQTFVKEAI
ncbi:alpha/beta hydrolase [Arthrobacter sp. MYb227]|uniref:alpha/beta hydrolase family protein n=1 Tax=Arthrobacter sp. MYb227 TaxID=1848601 RepID=UPI000CFD88BD|nr:alpha/beta fold hydrolase [Arthrobacter sp. MYb227]PQZ87329.1 alpha/beta hydrolase [Arthrobacter sp. MYb227]